MSAISFRTADPRPFVPATGSRRRVVPHGRLIDVAFAAIVVAMLTMMRLNPGGATVPFHLLYLSLMLAYGLRLWPLIQTVLVILTVALSTGFLMLRDYSAGVIEGQELTEIPLMPALVVAMVWHARRCAAAHEALQAISERQRTMFERERTFFRDTAHAIRTPVTIARGHLELAGSARSVARARDDVEVALKQLDRMSMLSNRLLALAQLDSGATLPSERIDFCGFVHEMGSNWGVDRSRTWSVECPPGAMVAADPVWLADAVDALVENAVHFTLAGGTIEIRGVVDERSCTIRVSDDGPGIAAEDCDHVFERFWHRLPPNGTMGSGLGLAMALATARACGGDLQVTSSGPLGGATFSLVLPRLGRSHLA